MSRTAAPKCTYIIPNPALHVNPWISPPSPTAVFPDAVRRTSGSRCRPAGRRVARPPATVVEILTVRLLVVNTPAVDSAIVFFGALEGRFSRLLGANSLIPIAAPGQTPSHGALSGACPGLERMRAVASRPCGLRRCRKSRPRTQRGTLMVSERSLTPSSFSRSANPRGELALIHTLPRQRRLYVRPLECHRLRSDQALSARAAQTQEGSIEFRRRPQASPCAIRLRSGQIKCEASMPVPTRCHWPICFWAGVVDARERQSCGRDQGAVNAHTLRLPPDILRVTTC